MSKSPGGLPVDTLLVAKLKYLQAIASSIRKKSVRGLWQGLLFVDVAFICYRKKL
jgi:hypothetical protein